jgi:uncharacterized protein involved in response to NO
MTSIPRPKDYSGPAILSYGFRPFFLGGAIYAGLGILIWLPIFFGTFRIPTAFSPVDWHIHEMLYGYLPAAVTGFLLTAIPNWTGRLPLRGFPLAALAAAWIAGRVAILFSPVIGPLAAGAIDLLFLTLVTAAAAREIVAGQNWRNLPPVGILIVLAVGDVTFHLEAYKGMAEIGTRLGIAAAIALITLVGGRLIPSFTHNWLARENPGRLPVPFGRYDLGALAVSTIALVLWVTVPDGFGSAVLMMSAGAAHAIRLLRWAGDRALRDRLVLILHVGYAFVPVGFVLLAMAVLLPRHIPTSAGIHAWTVGAIGIMTLAVMTRASLGHSGQRLHAGALTQAIYATIVVAALTRVCAAFEPDLAAVLLTVAGAAWIAAFWGFAAGYGPSLARPRENFR